MLENDVKNGVQIKSENRMERVAKVKLKAVKDSAS